MDTEPTIKDLLKPNAFIDGLPDALYGPISREQQDVIEAEARMNSRAPARPMNRVMNDYCECDPSPDAPDFAVAQGDIVWFQCSKCGKEGFTD